MDIQNAINSINWTSSGWDLFVIIAFVAGIFLYNLNLGRDRVFVILISSYISLALVSKLSLTQEALGIQLGDSFADSAIVFAGGILLLFFILSNSVFSSVFDRGPRGSWFQTTVVGFLQIGFVISAAVSFLSPEEAGALSDFMKFFFVENQAQFAWLVSPIIAVMIFRG